jgi:hypothetical protein
MHGRTTTAMHNDNDDYNDDLNFLEDRDEVSVVGPQSRPLASGVGPGGAGAGNQELAPAHLSAVQERVRRAREQEAELDRLRAPIDDTSPVTPEQARAATDAELAALRSVSAEEGLSLERKHECAGCFRPVNTRWKFCLRCAYGKPWVEQAKESEIGQTFVRVVVDEENPPLGSSEGRKRWEWGDERKPKWGTFGDEDWPQDTSFDCGCAWNEDHYVMLDPGVGAGPTVVARAPDDGCAACSGSGRLRDKHSYLHKGKRPKVSPDISVEGGSYEHAMSVVDSVMAMNGEEDLYSLLVEKDEEFKEEDDSPSVPDFAAGGWQIDTAAPEVPHRPGEPAPKGPAPKGITRPDLIWKALVRAAFTPESIAYLEQQVARGEAGEKIKWNDVYTWWGLLIATSGVNVQAVTNISGRGHSTIKRWVTNSKKVSQASAKGGGENEVNYSKLRQHIDARFDCLERRQAEDAADIFRAIMAFRETPAEDWQRYVDEHEYTPKEALIGDRRYP